jgi:hypothetical protein
MKRYWTYILTVPVLAVFMLASYGTAFSDDKPDDKRQPLTYKTR